MDAKGWTETQIRGFRAVLLAIALVRELSLLPLEGFLAESERIAGMAAVADPKSFVGFHGTDAARSIREILKAAVTLKTVFLSARKLQAEIVGCEAAQHGQAN